MLRFLLLATASALAVSTEAGAFELKAANPEFTVTVPNLPAIRLEKRPSMNTDASIEMFGEDPIYRIGLLVTKAPKQTSARECAGSFLRTLVARPGMPDRDSIYRAPLDPNTFLVLYILGEPGRRQLHAHLLSSASATHCIEAHVSRELREGEDEDGWRESFAGARIQDAQP